MESWWQQIGAVFVAEFADFGDRAEVTRTLLRLMTASVLGAVLGFEREAKGKAAGVKTHMLVAMGAAIFIVVAMQAGIETGNLARIIEGIITGIGFLGAGAILKSRSGRSVEGLTTAAGIWMTAAIGVAVGLGHQGTAVISTILALVIFSVMPRIVKRFDMPNSDNPLNSDRPGDD